MHQSLIKIAALFNKTEKKKLLLIFFFMIGAAVLETIGVGLIFPLTSIIANSSYIEEQAVIKTIYDFLGFQSHDSFLLFAVTALLGVFIFKNIYMLSFIYIQYRVVLNQQVKLSSRLLKEYLMKPYTFHLQRNSSELLRNITNEVPRVFNGIIISTFQLLTEVLVIIFIVTLLIFIAPLATIVAGALLGGSVGIFYSLFRRKISKLGIEQQEVSGNMIKWVNQSLGASKDVKVTGKESFFIQSFQKYSQIKANNNRFMQMLNETPRFFIETILVSTVLLTMLIIIQQGANTAELVSTMALFAMAAFRLMPSINKVMAMITTIKYCQPALNIIYEDLYENKDEAVEKVNLYTPELLNGKVFKDKLRLKNVYYSYPGQEGYALKDISLDIPIGSSAAFIGSSGAGKSTVVDLMLGLLKPESGEMLVDGEFLQKKKAIWQKKIGYIPQFIFLSDDSILRNIAFGIDDGEIDEEAVWKALEQAQLKEYVNSLPDSVYTNIGEHGVKLSGGQRQRIGIARALYHNPEIIFMDEATSALDTKTEKEIMKAIDKLKGEKTLIIIAHRISTIENCDTVFKIENGTLIETEHKKIV